MGSPARSPHRHLQALTQRRDLVGTDVQLAVAEPVDPQHLAHQRAPRRSRGSGTTPGHQQIGIDRVAELEQVDAVAQVRGRRGEHVATGEGGTGARPAGSRCSSAPPRGRRRRPSPPPGRADRCRDRRARPRRRPPRSRRPCDRCRRPDRRRPARRPTARTRSHRASARLPARTSNGAISWVRSITDRVRGEVAHDRLHDADELVARCRSRRGTRPCRSGGPSAARYRACA